MSAFDRRKSRGAVGVDLGLAFELGRTYVPPSAGPPVPRVLDERRMATLRAWADALVPGDAHWPAAGAVQAPEYADACAGRSPVLRRALREAVDLAQAAALARAGTVDLGELAPDDRTAVLRALEQEHPQLFGLVLELTFEGYYRAGAVQETARRRTGYRPEVPVVGMAMEPFDEARVTAMRARAAAYRTVEERR